MRKTATEKPRPSLPNRLPQKPKLQKLNPLISRLKNPSRNPRRKIDPAVIGNMVTGHVIVKVARIAMVTIADSAAVTPITAETQTEAPVITRNGAIIKSTTLVVHTKDTVVTNSPTEAVADTVVTKVGTVADTAVMSSLTEAVADMVVMKVGIAVDTVVMSSLTEAVADTVVTKVGTVADTAVMSSPTEAVVDMVVTKAGTAADTVVTNS
ncbi:MAG: hypothetical protein V4719_05715, partial [Planctomycetota bacterium]